MLHFFLDHGRNFHHCVEEISIMDAESPKKPTTVPVSVPAELNELLDEAVEKTRLSKQALMRLSMEKGLELVVKALALTPEQIARATEPEAA